MTKRALVLEQDRRVREQLVEQLARDGLDADGRDSVAGARVRCAGWAPDAVIVGELEAPGRGLAFVRAIRAGVARAAIDPGVVAIAVGSGGELELVRAFEAGCDDFVRAPVAYLELRARLQAALARPRRRACERIEVGGLRVDGRSRTVSYRDRPVLLSELEFGLLARLAREPRAVVRREELWREVWGCEVAPRSRTIDAHAARLRRKLSSAGAEGLVAARRGVGYSLIAPHAVAA